ncbi:hypothetical protein NKJ23_22420 [Mesorhizobium sp. M0184]
MERSNKSRYFAALPRAANIAGSQQPKALLAGGLRHQAAFFPASQKRD